MFQAILATAFLATPAAASAAASAAAPVRGALPQDVESMFPVASGPLSIEIDADTPAITYLELLSAYGRLTGQYFTYSEDSEGYLKGATVRLDRSVTVPADEVPLFVESLLVRSHLVLNPLPSKGIRIVQVESLLTQARSTLRSNAIRLPSGRLDLARAHPASLFMTTVELENSDVRQLANSMRTMITDANTQQMLPAGNSNSMVLIGFGTQIADLAQMLLEVDAAAKPTASTGPEFDVVRLEKANAPELAAVLASLIHPPEAAAAQVQEGAVPRRSGPRIRADQRTNSLLLSGMADEIAMLKELIARLNA